jgi:hypothetical protein
LFTRSQPQLAVFEIHIYVRDIVRGQCEMDNVLVLLIFDVHSRAELEHVCPVEDFVRESALKKKSFFW